jgi:hypothetical protein
MTAGLRALLEGVIDYAGLFPPARLPLVQAVRNYLDNRRGPDGWMLARFVCPAARLADLGALLPDPGPGEAPVPVAALGRGGDTPGAFQDGLCADLEAILAFRRRFGGRAAVDVLELRQPDEVTPLVRPDRRNGGPDAARDEAVGPLALFCELPVTQDWFARQAALFAVLRGGPERGGFKFRCGGLEPAAFPSAGDLAYVIVSCRDAGVPLKFTAGLHHPLRRLDPGLGVKMHGFVNVFGAAVLAHARGLGEGQLRPILEDEDPGDFAFDEAGFRWKEHRATTAEIVAARRQVVSFGSCSFDEPRDDLRALGWLS